MDNIWFEILVIILSVFLAVFLIVGIFIAYKIYELIKVVKRITEKADNMANKAEHVAMFFERTATPVALVKLVSNITGAFAKKKSKKG